MPNYDKALEFYNNAIELDPLNKQAFVAKGLLLKKL
jgi:lipoprotein NlpI